MTTTALYLAIPILFAIAVWLAVKPMDLRQ